MSRDGALIGVFDHCGWAILVTVGRDGSLLDRRRVELVDRGLPKLPHHHEAQTLSPEASDPDAHFLQLRRSIGPPWGKNHKVAMAAAIVAARSPSNAQSE